MVDWRTRISAVYSWVCTVACKYPEQADRGTPRTCYVGAAQKTILVLQVGTLNYMSPEAILGGATNIRGGPPMKVRRQSGNSGIGAKAVTCKEFRPSSQPEVTSIAGSADFSQMCTAHLQASSLPICGTWAPHEVLCVH